MTGEQCREARERLNWTRFDLATAADVPVSFIVAFEHGNATPGSVISWGLNSGAARPA